MIEVNFGLANYRKFMKNNTNDFTEKNGGRGLLDRPLNPPLILKSRTSSSRFKSTSPEGGS